LYQFRRTNALLYGFGAQPAADELPRGLTASCGSGSRTVDATVLGFLGTEIPTIRQAPVTLKSEDGLTEFEVHILKYEFPDIQVDWDANWLTLAVRVRTAERSWEAIDSCLLTWEADELLTWLSGLTRFKQQDTGIDFLEPDLAFEAAASGEQSLDLSVRLGYGLLPLERRRPGWEEMVVPMRISYLSLREAVRALGEQVGRFPIRGARGRADQ
jgi:hypothetical protein